VTTEFPTDANGDPLNSGAAPRQHSHAERGSLLDRLQRYTRRRIDRTLAPFAEAVRDRFIGHDDPLDAVRSDLDAVRREIAEVQRLLDVHRHLAGMAARIAALEADGTITTTARPTNGSAHHHDG